MTPEWWNIEQLCQDSAHRFRADKPPTEVNLTGPFPFNGRAAMKTRMGPSVLMKYVADNAKLILSTAIRVGEGVHRVG